MLLVVDELASRLTLQTLLQAGGYRVDVAASAEEAISKLDQDEYQLVLSESEMESSEAGSQVLSYARVKEYRPATALVTAYKEARAFRYPQTDLQQVSISTNNVSTLLDKVAGLIGIRAQRRAHQVPARAVQ